MPRRLQQANVLLADAENIEVPVGAEEWQQRLDKEAGVDQRLRLELERQPVIAQEIGGNKQRQPFALVLPVGRILQQLAAAPPAARRRQASASPGPSAAR
jgi:hypothetical protein